MNVHAPRPGLDVVAARPVAPVTLSLCVPTFNRARFLDYLLTQAAATWTFDFSYEIVISDNASTDDTPAVIRKHAEAGLPIVYVRQEVNKGGEINVLSAFRRGRGRYLLYIGDDDLIIPEALAEAVTFLEDNNDVRALYAPWELYDDVEKRTMRQVYTIPSDRLFRPGEEGELFKALIAHHIFPECVIYRADAMRNITPPRRFCYWAFTYLAHVAASGPVAFRAKPFYRSVTATPLAVGRIQAGHEQAMVDWDTYRGGLEYFIYVLLQRSRAELNSDQRTAIRDTIDGFIQVRMTVALRLWLERGDYLRAHDILCRLRYLKPDAVVAPAAQISFALPVFAQTLARLANGIAGLSAIAVASDDIVDVMRAILAELGLRPDIAVGPARDVTDVTNCLVIITDEADRQRFCELGFLPGLIVCEGELMGNVAVT